MLSPPSRGLSRGPAARRLARVAVAGPRRRRDARAAAVRRSAARPRLPGLRRQAVRGGGHPLRERLLRGAQPGRAPERHPRPPRDGPACSRRNARGHRQAQVRERRGARQAGRRDPRRCPARGLRGPRHVARGVQCRGRRQGGPGREGHATSASSSTPASTSWPSAGPDDRSTKVSVDATAGGSQELSLTPPPPPQEARRASTAPGPHSPPSTKPFGPAVFFVGLGLTAVGAGLTVWSGIDTQNNPGPNAVKADCVGQGTSCPQYQQGLSSQLRTNVLIAATGGLGLVTAVVGIFFTQWSHPDAVRERRRGRSSDARHRPGASSPAGNLRARRPCCTGRYEACDVLRRAVYATGMRRPRATPR